MHNPPFVSITMHSHQHTSGRAFSEPATSTDIISSTTSDPVSTPVRSAAENIARLFLIFVPSSKQRHTGESSEFGPGSLSSILSTFFNFSFIFCFSPFKVKLDNTTGHYVLYKCLPQKLFSFLLAVASMLIRLAEFRESWPNKRHENWNPVSYFRVSNTLSNLVFHFVVLLTLWTHNKSVLQILNFLQRPSNPFYLRQGWSSHAPSFIVIFCILNALVASICFIFGTDLLPGSNWDPDHLYTCFLHKAKYTLFIHSQPVCHVNSSLPASVLTPSEHCLATLYAICLYFRRVNGLYEELFIFVGSFTLWLSSSSFSQGLSDPPVGHNKWAVVYDKYLQLTELSDLINNTYAPVYLAFTVTSIFYYSINLDNLLVSEDIGIRAKFIAFYSGLILTYLLSADICRQIGYLEIWISKHLDEKSMSDLSHKQLSLILHEIATCRVGMTGCHLFTITYSMVAQLAGVLITYFIISVQYRDV